MSSKRYLLNEYLVEVKFQCGAYVARAHGMTVSCTSGAQQAVERLAAKLWGEGEHPVYAQPSGDWLLRRARHDRQRLLTWIVCAEEMPDADMVVLISSPTMDPPVWLGYFDGNEWLIADGVRIGDVTHWADIPDGMEVR